MSSQIRRRNSNSKKLTEKTTMPRRIRIVYNDPDLTDSSSSDEDESCPKKKRAVLEVTIPRSVPSKTVPSRVDRSKASRDSAGSSAKKSRGVRLRPWGKWSAEIRNPITRTRVWLGTFLTEKEASMAYEAAWKRIQEAKLALLRPKETELSLSSPSSVLDVPDPLNKQRATNETSQEMEVGEAQEPSFAELFEKQQLQISSPDMDFGLRLDLSSHLFEEVGDLEFHDFEFEDVPFLSVGSCRDDFPSLDSINWEDFEF